MFTYCNQKMQVSIVDFDKKAFWSPEVMQKYHPLSEMPKNICMTSGDQNAFLSKSTIETCIFWLK